jgi:hypothetical protein
MEEMEDVRYRELWVIEQRARDGLRRDELDQGE